MRGHVYEWIGEWYQHYHTDPARWDYYPLDKKDFWVIRGVRILQLPSTIRTYWRVYTFRDNRSLEFGIRCAKPLN